MPNTAKGIPYPDPTDPVANGDVAMKAIADWLNAHGFKAVHAGSVVANLSASVVAATTGTFPAGTFTAAPMVICQVRSSTSLYFCVVSATAAGSFNVTVRRSDGTATTAAITVDYIAVQLA